MAICYLVGAGAFTLRGLYPKEGDYVIAADGGYMALRTAGLKPDLLVGDFDSLGEIPADIPYWSFPREKNETDMALALSEGMARGYRTFRLYGASGGRDDHTYANLQLLVGASRQGCNCKMICPKSDVYAVTNGTLNLQLDKGTIVSVFCHGSQARDVTLTGMQYPLNDAVLTDDKPLGVSNEVAEDEASVCVKDGTLLVYVMLQM